MKRGTPTPPAAPAASSSQPAAGGLSGLARNPKVIAGGVGVVILLALVTRNSGGSTGQTDPNATGYDSTANDVYQSLMGQIQALQSQIEGASPGASTPTPAPPAPAPAPPVTRAQLLQQQQAAATGSTPTPLQAYLGAQREAVASRFPSGGFSL